MLKTKTLNAGNLKSNGSPLQDRSYNHEVGKRIKAARGYRCMSIEQTVGSYLSAELLQQAESTGGPLTLCQLRGIAINLDVPIYFLLGEAELMDWFDERQFLRLYRILRPTARRHIQGLISDLVEDLALARERS